MHVFIATDFTLNIDNNGEKYLNANMSSILKRYKNAFGEVAYCSRVSRTGQNSAIMINCSDLIDYVVEIHNLGEAFIGQCVSIMQEAIFQCDLVVVRIPSIIAFRAADIAQKMGKPVLAETMGCAWDAYWGHSLMGKVIAPYMFLKMKSVIKHSDYVHYVTEKFLQKKYPCTCPTMGCSNVALPVFDQAVLEQRLKKIGNTQKTDIILMTSAAVDVRYKGQEYVIRAMPVLREKGINVRYVLAGKGDWKYLKGVAKKCGVEQEVIFLGMISRDDILNYLDVVDVYIQPSLQEGLPRALIEALSRGCPALGARTAGIPELLLEECVFERASVGSIVKTVFRFIHEDWSFHARINMEKSKEYDSNILDDRRSGFYSMIKDELIKSVV